MAYRTRTYIAADWDTDEGAVSQLKKWNDSNYWSLSFTDAHDLTSARDGSLNCSIKSSLKSRLDASKRFVLIVGSNTDTVTAGSCIYCGSYNSYTKACAKGHSIDYRSYIKYECDEALKAYNDGNMKIIVLYNSCSVNKSRCPSALRNVGIHSPMGKVHSDGKCYYDYATVKKAFDDGDNE